MRVNLWNISRRVAALGGLALFPGFVLYHYAVAQGWIVPFLGGMFGNVSLMLAIACLLLLPWIMQRQLGRGLVPGLVVFALVMYAGLWALAHVLLIHEPYAAAAFREAAATIGTWLAALLVGLFFPFNDRHARIALAVSAGLIVVVMLHAIARFQSPLGPYLTFSEAEQDLAMSTYQGIGRSIVVTAIFLAALLQRPQLRFLVLIAGCFVLVLLGSRTDLFTLLALTLLLVGQLTVRRANPLASAASLSFALLLGYFAAPVFLTSRAAEIFTLSASSSWMARSELAVRALEIIEQSPVLGGFGYHFLDGGSGFYAHNALSAWTNFGILGFTMYLGLILYFTVLSLRRTFVRGLVPPAWFAAAYLNVGILIQAIAATPVFSPLPALAWGVALNALRTTAPRAPEPRPVVLGASVSHA